MRDLVAGERVGVGDALTLTLDAPLRPPLALAVIALDAVRRGSAAWPPLDSVARELRPAARFDEGGALHLALSALPAAVERLAVVAFVTSGPGGGVTFRDLGALAVTTGDLRFRVDLIDRADTALILVELYRHGGGWRLAANGGGFVHGLPALASAHGVDEGWARRVGGGSGPDHAPDRERRRDGATGSGVAVDARHVLTNAHVVEDARRIDVGGERGTLASELVFSDAQNDLALLRVAEPLPAAARFRSGLELHLGEEVVALGFPLQGLLGSGPQASAGNVAGLCGVGNDCTRFQFTAPIASGNSGGPILDASGQVIGLVCSSLNLDRVRASGSNAENVNFGIRGAVVRSFLDAFGLTPALAEPAAPMGRAAMVREARGSLYRISVEC